MDSLSDADAPHGHLFYRVNRSEIGFLSALFESYEDFGAVRTIDPVAAIIEILYAPDFFDEVVALMDSLDIPSLARTTESLPDADTL
ncbi:MAG: DUF4911 domain-containing protein [Nitrospirota bacterium]|nr:DUF4911 domain-containing protein [Nitrospirota bacterium]